MSPTHVLKSGVFIHTLNVAMGRYQIVGIKRIAAFFAQIDHESARLRYVRELGGNAYLSITTPARWRSV